MASPCKTLLALLCVSLVQFLVGAELVCSSSNSSALRVTFDSHQNKTGHWTHSVGLSRRGLPREAQRNKKRDLWTVDVDYTPENCDEDEKDSLSVLFSLSPLKRTPDYKFYSGHGYYKFHTTPVPWAVAKETCEKEDAHLAIINSQEEADLMTKLLVNASTGWSWVGLSKIDYKEEFTTLFGDPASSTGFTKWNTGVDPAKAGARSSAVIHKTLAALSYDAITAKYVSVCEQDW